MDNLKKLVNVVREKKAIFIVVASLVVSITTYSMILPAFTLDEEEAKDQGGIDIEEQVEKTSAKDTESVGNAKTETAETEKVETKKESADEAHTIETKENGYGIVLSYDKDAKIPENAKLEADEIKDGKDFDELYDKAESAVKDAAGKDAGKKISKIKLYDISIKADGKEIEPESAVDVSIDYDKGMKLAKEDEKGSVSIVHFTEDKNGKLKAELLDDKDYSTEITNNTLKSCEFSAESFSVYGIIYTVDFEYEDEETGKTYAYSLTGGKKIMLSELAEKLGMLKDGKFASKAAFISEVKDVKFTDESLVKVSKDNDSNDWVLESEKPFKTNEELTITMKNGDVITVKVTDAVYNDITSLLSKVTIDGASQSSDGSYNVFPGTPYNIELRFEETPQDTFNRSGNLTYKLPNGVKIPEATSGTLTPSDSSQAEIYSINYTVATDGTVTFTWDIKQGKEQDFASLPGLFVDLRIEAEFDENASSIDWNGKAQVTVDNTHDVGVKKSASLNQDGYMYYEVTVTSTGDNKNISLTDIISGTALTLDQNSITETTSHGATFSNKTNKGFDISIPELKHGESATIKYRAKVDYDVLASEAGVEKGKYGSATTTGNQIRINGTDDNPNNDTSETHADHNINFSSAGKSVTEGHYNEQTGKRTINWQIKANDEHRTTISYIHDKMREGSDKMNYSGEGITVKVVNPDWSVAATYTVPWSQLGVNENSKEWTYNIPDQYKDKNYSFVIDYTTDVDVSESIVPVTVKNDVDTDYGTGGTNGKAEPAPGSKLDMEKSVVEADIPGGTVTWNITVDVPATGLDSCVVTDTLPSVSGPETFTDGFDSSSFDAARDVAGLIDGESVSLDATQSGKVIFTFHKNGQPGLYPVEGGRKVTITLTTTLDEDWMEYEITQDYLRYYYTHTNLAKVVANSYTVEDSASVTVNSTDPDMIKKVDASYPTGFHWKTWNEEDNLKGWMYRLYLYGISDNTFEDGYLTITDTFDDRYLAYYDPDNEDVFENTGNTSWHQVLSHGNENGNYSDPKEIEATVDGGTITFRIPKSAFLNEAGGYDRFYHISYFLHVKDKDTKKKMDEDALAAGGTLKMKNTAVWAYSEPSEVEVEHKIPIIGKDYTVKDEAAGVYDFTIKVNEGGNRLGDADYLEVTDSYTNLTIDYATLKCVPEDALLTYTHSGNTVKYFVKNGVPVTLTYTASALESGAFSNTVEVNNQSVTKEGTANITSRGSTGAREASIKILKHSGTNLLEGIPGVQFELYEYDESYTNHYNPNEKVLSGTYTTGSNGMFTIQHIPLAVEDGVYTTHTKRYVLHEVEPPEGYKALPHDYEFTVDTQTASYGQYIYLHDDTLPISNEPIKEDDISITVNKIWPDGDADLPELIRVRLYQKDSRTASNSSAREIDVAEMTRGTDGSWKHSFTGLDPEKAYFIKEDPVEGYTASYSSNNILGLEQSGTINITNTKDEPDDDTTSITVKKKWMQGDKEITDIDQKKDLSATVELVRYRTRKSQTALHFYHVGDAGWTKIADESIPQGSDVEFEFTASATSAGGLGVFYSIDTTKAAYQDQGTSLVSGKPDQANGSKQTIKVDSEGHDDLYIVWRYNNAPTISEFNVVNEGTSSSSGDANAAIDNTYTNPATLILDRENGWRASFSNLPTSGTGSDDGKSYSYTYGIREIGTSDPSYVFDTYSVNTYAGEGSNNATVAVDSGSTVTVTNKKEAPQTGSLKIEKILKVDGNTPTTAEQKALVAGTYQFTISSTTLDPAVSRTVSITFGTDGTISAAAGTGVTIENGVIVVSDLNADEYTISENTPTNGTRLIKVGNTDITSDSTEADKKASVTVTAGDTTEVPTASFVNNRETINVTVEKEWADNNNAKENRPSELKVTLSNGREVTLNNDNNWTQTVTGLPKYNSEGQAIEYTWTEGTVGQGYTLIGTSKDTETSDTGVVTEITTLTNGLDEHYNPKTSFLGTKTWEDDGTIRPDEIVLILYQGEGENKKEVTRKTLEKPENDTGVWHYEFTNIPVFDDNGNAIDYSVEEVLPNGYVCTMDQKTPGYKRDEANDTVSVNEPNDEMTISTGVNLGFIVMKHGNEFIIWTPRKASDTEIAAIKEMVAGESNKIGDNEFNQIMSREHTNYYGVPNNSISKGNMTASIYMDGDNVNVHFGNKKWSQLAWGQLAYTYSKGNADLINTQQYTGIGFEKKWIDKDQQEIDWDQDIQVTVSRNKENGTKDNTFSLVYNISKSAVEGATSGTIDFAAANGDETTPKLKLTITTEAKKKNYSFTIDKLTYSSESDGKYTYYVEETNAQLAGYLEPSYTNTSAPTGAKAAYDKGIILNKQEGGVELPSAGGPGTHWMYMLGVLLVLASAIAMLARYKAEK